MRFFREFGSEDVLSEIKERLDVWEVRAGCLERLWVR